MNVAQLFCDGISARPQKLYQACLCFTFCSSARFIVTKCLEKGLVIMAFHGGANLEGTKGDHIMFSPAYNVTKEQIQKIVEIFIESAEEVFREDVI